MIGSGGKTVLFGVIGGIIGGIIFSIMMQMQGMIVVIAGMMGSTSAAVSGLST